jgi:POT family proton-dependent oligopeptide transporter
MSKNITSNSPETIVSLARGVKTLFFIQIFSTLSFSVLYSTLVLYATNGLHLSSMIATAITGSFIAFNYALHLLGGYCGGRFLSYRQLFAIGMVLQIISCLLFSIPSTTTLYWGLAAFLSGAGMNVTCVNCMLTQLFEPNDKRREGAFLWNYSGMNIGFLIGFTISGYFQLENNYHTLFLFTAIGNIIALLVALFNWSILRDKNTYLTTITEEKKLKVTILGFIIIAVLLLALRWLIMHATFSNHLVMGVGAIMIFVIATLAIRQHTVEACRKVWAYLILTLSSLSFWILYLIAPMGLTLFISNNVNRVFLGFQIAPQWVLNINSIVIILGGPLLTILFQKLRNIGFKISIPFQFSMALILIGLGFVALPIGIHFADARGYTNFNWIIFSYTLQAIGELFISPIGYAMVGRLAPVRLQGVLMGTWLMVSGVAATFSDYFSSITIGNDNSLNPLTTNASYSHTFSLLGWSAIACGIVLAFFIPAILRLMGEEKK